MSIKRINEFPEGSGSLTTDDVFLFMDDPEGSAVTKKISLSSLVQSLSVSGSYATLVDGKVPSSQLPSYVDDVVEYSNLESLPTTGEVSKIYVTLDNNKTYRWSGSTYIEISASPGSTDAVPEGSVNLYYTDARTNDSVANFLTAGSNIELTTINDGSVSEVTIISKGAGYPSAPVVTFSAAPAGGQTATGVANVSGGQVQSITVTNPGSGYTVAPTVTIAPQPGPGAPATATCSLVFTLSNLNVAVTGVSLVGHTHTSSDITDFNTAASGLIPVKDLIGGTGISISSISGVYTINSTGSGVLADQAESLVTTVFNNTGSPIPKMTAVYINGGQGDLPTVSLAIATTDMTSAGTYGLTYEAIPNMQSGKVIVFGALTGLDTDQFNPTAPTGDVNGSVIYLSPFVSGGLTLIKPSAPNHIVAIGTIVRTHQNEGVIEVRVQNGFELEELHNVAISGVVDEQFLQYNADTELWIPSSSGNFTSLTVNGSGVSLDGHTHTIPDVSGLQTALDLKLNSIEVDTDLIGGPGISLLYSNSNNSLSIYTNNENYITDLGAVSGSTPINYDPTNRSIQTLTLGGTATTFTKGTGWPSSSSVSVDTVLRITVSSATTITWTIVNDWFTQPAAGALAVGTHLFLLRAIGSSIIEGHYIGNKTN